ncbi:hypothetical protein CHU95_01035 [Niveispirillum lacus]|uniref:Uncharacterized protein n=1 Tax=Niveispirillum lacus TaxID=1981099 RepID=A0A255ZA30_9PROT|nr:hypothetical protein [Niveispirillum lacus]OYQ37480.1 hypothetical protein CHU95_01035 [Niveispirillum lacus]
MKGQDIIILLKLVSLHDRERECPQGTVQGKSAEEEDPFSMRGLGAALGISKTEVSASIRRSLESGLAIKGASQVKPNRQRLLEFILHGLRYVFPAKPGAVTRGVPTGFSAPMLKGQVLAPGNYGYVWPSAHGEVRGESIPPLFKSAAEAVESDPRLYEYLALVDAIRIGRQRETNLAGERLRERLMNRG